MESFLEVRDQVQGRGFTRGRAGSGENLRGQERDPRDARWQVGQSGGLCHGQCSLRSCAGLGLPEMLAIHGQ